MDVGRVVELLVEHGPALPFPFSSGIAGSRHRHMRELRIQHRGRPDRVLYALDPRRAAILFLGGDKTWADIKSRVKPGTRAQIQAGAHRLSEELHLSQLRKARGLTQEAMAELLGVSQAEVSKMERRSELYIGTLKKFIEAMNGELVLAARFADGVEVPIKLAETEATT